MGYTMIKKTIKIKTEYIKLSDLLKFASVVSSGSDAKHLVLEGNVMVEGEVCLMRGKKIYPGMNISCKYDDDYQITVE